MDSLGLDFNITGSVMTKQELEEVRKKRGECITCGQKCFKKKLFKMIPLDIDGKVLNGRCLHCKPLLPRDIADVATNSSSRSAFNSTSNSTTTTARSSSGKSMNNSTQGGGGGGGGGGPATAAAATAGQPILTAAVSRRVPTSQVDFNRFTRTQMNIQQQRSIQSLQHSIGSGGSQQHNFAGPPLPSSSSSSTPLSFQGKGRSSFQRSTPVSSSLAPRHSFSTTTTTTIDNSNRRNLPPPPRTRSERSLSSIGSASVVSGSNMSAPRVTPTLPDGRRVWTSDVPPTTPKRTSSGSLSPVSTSRKQLQQQQQQQQQGKTFSKPDMSSGPPPPWAPPSLSPFVTEGKHQRTVPDPKSSPTSVATLPTQEQKHHASEKVSHQQFVHQPFQSDGASVPSQQDLERTHQTIMAAQKAGIYHPPPAITSFEPAATSATSTGCQQQIHSHSYPVVMEELVEDEKHRNHYHLPVPPNVVIHNHTMMRDGATSNTMGRMESEVTIDTSVLTPAIRSGMPRSDDSSIVDSESAYDILPVHGVLNRGGAFVPASFRQDRHNSSSVLSPHNSSRWSNGGGSGKGGAQLPGKSSSFRTTGSLSSYEDDLHPQAHQRTRMGKNMDDLFETSESSLSKDGKEDGNGNCMNKKQSESSMADVNSRTGKVSRTISAASGSNQSCTGQSTSDKLKSDYFELVETLREACYSPEVAATFLQELASIQLGRDDADHLADLDAPKVVVDTMSSCKKSYDVQYWGCKIIRAMGCFEQTQTKLMDASCINVLLEVANAFSERSELLEVVILAISSLISNQKSVKLFMEGTTVEAIVKIVTDFSSHVPILIQSCEVIRKLATCGHYDREIIGQKGAGGAVFTAMVMNQSDVELQVSALTTLNELCVDSEENMTMLVNLGLCDVIVNAMENHRDEPDVQQVGASLIATLSVIDENKHAIGDNSGRLVVVRAMCVHPDCEGVVKHCMNALYLLTLDLIIAEKLMQEGAIEIIVKAMQDHVVCDSIQELGCGVLANLSKLSDDAKMDIVDLGGLDQINVAMVCHEHASGLHVRACEAILWLSIDDNIRAINASGLVQLAKKSRDLFPEQCEQSVKQLLQIVQSFYEQLEG
ncbi:hypothetical protein IV203_008106 [Nitzschia inconspicua]|uniref:LRRK2 ARM repeat domain-containing protein n=1 Tax=Nitzschia inconspicua TaxID=303405 RepID=A0A9K3KY67_9STRA|nr:hypothetical protein IV203_008106 [Nitzschia inconspicua]